MIRSAIFEKTCYLSSFFFRMLADLLSQHPPLFKNVYYLKFVSFFFICLTHWSFQLKIAFYNYNNFHYTVWSKGAAMELGGA
jgi:hypothetical protein